MSRVFLASVFFLSSTALGLRAEVPAATDPVQLPPLTVYSTSVANQDPTSSFAMPVTALRYEPSVDVQARNFAEGQADVSIRGGTFENTGFSIGALPIYDPQTGHYSAELPIAPAMLGAPTVRTGADNAMAGWNATAGSVAYGWKPVRTGGFAAVGAGDNNLFRSEVYSGYQSDQKFAGRTLAADASVAYSEGDGSRAFGDHQFTRYNARLQLANAVSQTDLFVGQQDKFTGWVNLYTPYNTAETDELETSLVLINHRVNFGADGDYFQAGAYQRNNDDHYSIPKFGYKGFHTTEVRGATVEGRFTVAEPLALRYRAGVVADELTSNKLTAGSYNSRTQVYAGTFADYTLVLNKKTDAIFTLGGNVDDSNRNSEAFSPMGAAALKFNSGAVRRVYVSYDESTQLASYTALKSAPSGLFGGNPNLGRSHATNYELGADSKCADWDLKTAVFFRQDRELVDWTYKSSNLNARSASAVDIDTAGVELIGKRTWGSLDLVLGYAWMDKNASYNDPTVIGSFYALNYAEERVTAAVVARLGSGFELRLDNEYRQQAENVLRRGNDTPILSALGLYYAVPSVKGLTLFTQVDNLWNVNYEEVPLVPGAPRELSLGARYAW
jgi:hypothetical protein